MPKGWTHLDGPCNTEGRRFVPLRCFAPALIHALAIQMGMDTNDYHVYQRCSCSHPDYFHIPFAPLILLFSSPNCSCMSLSVLFSILPHVLLIHSYFSCQHYLIIAFPAVRHFRPPVSQLTCVRMCHGVAKKIGIYCFLLTLMTSVLDVLVSANTNTCRASTINISCPWEIALLIYMRHIAIRLFWISIDRFGFVFKL